MEMYWFFFWYIPYDWNLTKFYFLAQVFRCANCLRICMWKWHILKLFSSTGIVFLFVHIIFPWFNSIRGALNIEHIVKLKKDDATTTYILKANQLVNQTRLYGFDGCCHMFFLPLCICHIHIFVDLQSVFSSAVVVEIDINETKYYSESHFPWKRGLFLSISWFSTNTISHFP